MKTNGLSVTQCNKFKPKHPFKLWNEQGNAVG